MRSRIKLLLKGTIHDKPFDTAQSSVFGRGNNLNINVRTAEPALAQHKVLFQKRHNDLVEPRILVAKKNEITFAIDHESIVDTLVDLNASGDIPTRITHNDTKLNNVMIDDNTGEGICVIDLDTVMPGLSLYDFGDCVRSGASTSSEDEKDLSKVSINLDLYEAITSGYLSTAGELLSEKEIELLPFSAKLITFEIGLRFLTDYLEGDVYFRIHRENHNLDRCRVQLEKVKAMQRLESEIKRMVASCRGCTI